MKRLRAEIGRKLGKQYIWTCDFQGRLLLHRKRGAYAFVYDLTRTGDFVLKSDGSVSSDSSSSYIKTWVNYDDYRDASLDELLKGLRVDDAIDHYNRYG